MPKPTLIAADETLERDIIETMLAGLKEWRSDLSYPESHSDMQGCVRALMMMFKIERRPLVVPLRLKCYVCEGLGHIVTKVDAGCRHLDTCPECGGKRYKEGK